jgi:hypothetical protein
LPRQRNILKHSRQKIHSLNFQTNSTGPEAAHRSYNRATVPPSLHRSSCRRNATRRPSHCQKCVPIQASTETQSFRAIATGRSVVHCFHSFQKSPPCPLHSSCRRNARRPMGLLMRVPIHALTERPSFQMTATRRWRRGNLAPPVANLWSNRNCESLPVSRNFPFRTLSYARNCQTLKKKNLRTSRTNRDLFVPRSCVRRPSGRTTWARHRENRGRTVRLRGNWNGFHCGSRRLRESSHHGSLHSRESLRRRGILSRAGQTQPSAQKQVPAPRKRSVRFSTK